MNQELAGVKTGGKFKPQAHPTFGTRPTRLFRHVFAKSFIERAQARRIKLAHLRKMFGKIPAAQEFRERSLRQLVGVQVGGLFYQTKSLDRSSGRNNTTHAEAG